MISGYPTNLTIEARALSISTAAHVNKMPFNGTLFRVGEPFEVASESGAKRRVTLCQAAAEKALRSLLAMGVEAAAELGGSPSSKVGLITSASILGDKATIEGFVYSSDFPELADVVKRDQSDIGFEVQARGTVTPATLAAAEVDAVTFIGARLVRRSAVSWPTSIAASAHRRTISAGAAYALSRGNIAAPSGDAKLSHQQIESCLSGIDDPVRRISLRISLERDGLA